MAMPPELQNSGNSPADRTAVFLPRRLLGNGRPQRRAPPVTAGRAATSSPPEALKLSAMVDTSRKTETLPNVATPTAAVKRTEDGSMSAPGQLMARGLGLAADAVLLTLASPFFAVWYLQRWLRQRTRG
jgi:hypothetical protein